ncbi:MULTISPECIES: flavodoxin [Bacteroides]|jgi:flavodoxin|uniref:Flavodoxin n=1 Tax=Bacteroides ovatus TaxID=28116 RepID=A0A1G8PPA5_BACOV|nr:MULTISPECIES: flavodoxin [Bacteroides]SDI94341.1 Flavodoxin [Bacteroides ovatus]
MRKLLLIPFLFFSLTIAAACSGSDDTEQPDTPDRLSGNSKILVTYFSATGNTQAVAERIVELTGADVYRIRTSVPYASNPYDDSDRIQNEAYNDLRPAVANLPSAETIAQYDTIFVGSPCWWHQPAMVVCTFLENYDLSGKTIIPFITYGATTYLNESMQKIYKLTPNSKHIPETLPEDLDPDDITTPGRPDDDGIYMPGRASGVEAWLRRMGLTVE